MKEDLIAYIFVGLIILFLIGILVVLPIFLIRLFFKKKYKIVNSKPLSQPSKTDYESIFKEFKLTAGLNKSMSFELAGTFNEDYKQFFYNDIKEYCDVKLNFEPHNIFDKNAIVVLWSGYRVGYVPKPRIKEVESLLKNGFENAFVTRIKWWYPDNNSTKEQIYVTITIPFKDI